jgi:hypothetical protein
VVPTVVVTDDLEALRRDLDDLSAQVLGLSQDVTDLTLAPTMLGGGRTSSRTHATVEDWVERYFRVIFQRPAGGEFRWCQQWFEHPEAVVRLTALWTSWEALRDDQPNGLVTWLVGCLDPQLPALLGRSGPFAACTETRHNTV